MTSTFDVAPWARATSTEDLRDKARIWTEMLAAALERGDYAAASGYSRHLSVMADELRTR
jgi:hypothetical protein